MSEAATDTSCFGDTSMNWTVSRCARMKFPACRALTRSSTSRTFSSTDTLAWATMYWSSSHADR